MFLAEVSIANKVTAQKVNGEEATLVSSVSKSVRTETTKNEL